MNKISFITASYNYADYIKETIESVINQTYQNWEMIIVDDGSSDNSIDVINEYCKKDNRIKLFQHENGINKGLSETIKLGIQKAKGDWIIFLESDDSISPDYIQKKLDVLNKYPNLKFIFNDVKMFGDSDCILNMQKYFKKLYSCLNTLSFPKNLVKEFANKNIIPTFSCVMLKKEIMNGIDFNSKDKRNLDWYIWVQLASKYEIYYLDEKLTNWRMHKNSYINQNYSMFDYLYFRNVQIQDIVYPQRKLLNRIIFLAKYFRKKIIKIHLNSNEKKIILFGKCIFEKVN